MNDDFYKYQLYYLQDLKTKLQENKITENEYTDKAAVSYILEFGLKYFVQRFESWCQTYIVNVTDIFNCIYAYSKYENDINNGYLIPDEDTIIGLHTLRYVLAISPSLSLKTRRCNHKKQSDLFSQLICINQIINITNPIQMYSIPL